MSLRLEFTDRYRLWSELIHTNAERVFIATDELPRIASEVAVELVLPDPPVTIVLIGSVVGLRAKSDRFPSGVFVRFGSREVEKCRAYLGLNRASTEVEAGRKASRVDCELKLRLTEPKLAAGCVAKNLSESGLLATVPGKLFLGQRVALVLTLDDGSELATGAEISWVREEIHLVGMQFVGMPATERERLDVAVQRLSERSKRASAVATTTLLVADDDPGVLTFLDTALTKHGFTVQRATRGDEAYTLIRRIKPRLVLLDVLMPGVDGKEICKRMRADAEMMRIPVILLSALDSGSLHAVANEAGASDYLSKPLRLGDLLTMVAKYTK